MRGRRWIYNLDLTARVAAQIDSEFLQNLKQFAVCWIRPEGIAHRGLGGIRNQHRLHFIRVTCNCILNVQRIHRDALALESDVC